MQGWQSAEKNAFDIYNRLIQAAKKWEKSNYDDIFLWLPNSADLNEAQEWYASPQATPAWACFYDKNNERYPLVINFYKASIHRKEKEEEEKISASKRKLHNAYLLTSLFALLFISSVILASIAFSSFKQAKIDRDIRTVTLFNSLTEYASIYAQAENYQISQQTLAKTYQYDSEIPTNQHRARSFIHQLNELKLNHQPLEQIDVGSQLFSIAINPHKEIIGFIGDNNKFYLVNINNPNRLYLYETFSQDNTKKLIAFAPSGDWFVIAGDNQSKEIEIWEFSQEKPEFISKFKLSDTESETEFSAIDISPNEKLLAIGDSMGNLKIFEYDNIQKPIFENKFEGWIYAIEFKDDQVIAVANNSQISLWNIFTKQSINTQKLPDDIYTISFSPDRQKLAVAGKAEQITVLKTPTLGVITLDSLYNLEGHQGRILDIQFRGDAQLISASADKTLRLWDIESETMLKMFSGHKAQVTGFVVDKEKLFSVSTDSKLLIWHIDLYGQQIMDTLNEPASVTIAPNTRYSAVGFNNGTLSLYDLQKHEFIPRYISAHSDIISRLAFSPNNQLLATGSLDHSVKVWEIVGTQLTEIAVIEHKSGISAITFSPDNQRLASSSYDGNIGLWEASNATTEFIPNAHAGNEINSVEFSQDGKLLLSAADRDVKLWHVSDNEITPTNEPITFKQDMQIFWATLSPDNQKIAVVGSDPHLVIVKDRQTGEEISFLSHKDSILKAIFAPNGKQLLTASGDATVRVWHLTDNLADSYELFPVYLPIKPGPPAPLWDFDFRCADQGTGQCWLAVPLTNNRLVLYDFGDIY